MIQCNTLAQIASNNDDNVTLRNIFGLSFEYGTMRAYKQMAKINIFFECQKAG